MAWVRIHDGAMAHPKVAGMSDKAFRLWVWSLSHCQQYLTDGLVVSDTVPGRLKRAADELVERRLWESHDVGYKVHDYLDWNDSRETVLSKRTGAKRRLDDWREAQSARNASLSGDVKRVSPPTSETLLARSGVGITKKEETSLEGDASAEVAKIAADFMERYPRIFAEERHGAHYQVREARDWPTFVELAKGWPDVTRLEHMFRVFLHLDQKRAVNAQGTPRQFMHHASECDSLLRQNGR